MRNRSKIGLRYFPLVVMLTVNWLEFTEIKRRTWPTRIKDDLTLSPIGCDSLILLARQRHRDKDIKKYRDVEILRYRDIET